MVMKSNNKSILAGLAAKGMRHVIWESDHSEMKLVVENEILNGLILSLFRRDSTVLWKFNWIWVASTDDNSEHSGSVGTVPSFIKA